MFSHGFDVTYNDLYAYYYTAITMGSKSSFFDISISAPNEVDGVKKEQEFVSYMTSTLGGNIKKELACKHIQQVK